MEKARFNQAYSKSSIKSPCNPSCQTRNAFCRRECPEWAEYEQKKKQEEENKKQARAGVVVSQNMARIIRKRLLSYKYSHRCSGF